MFHKSLLTPYSIPKFPSLKKRPPPPPEVVGNELEYIVETILDSRKCKRGKNSHVEYLIKWKGYDSEHNEWVSKKHVHAPEHSSIRVPKKVSSEGILTLTSNANNNRLPWHHLLENLVTTSSPKPSPPSTSQWPPTPPLPAPSTTPSLPLPSSGTSTPSSLSTSASAQMFVWLPPTTYPSPPPPRSERS